MNTALQIETMTAAELAFALDLAGAEGWNPGLHDAAAFHAADPGGFLVGRLDGQPIGCISAVSYGGRFGFVGLYIVLPAWRAKGYGIALWRAGMQRLAGHTIGLDGVLAQQDNYQRSGFRMAYSNLRFERSGPVPSTATAGIVAVDGVPFAQLHDYDRQVFAADREPFVRRWIAQPDSAALAHVAEGAIDGYGVIRRCRQGFKVGPLFAANADVAEALYLALCRHAGPGEPVYLDVPEVNAAARRLAEKYAMRKVFGTARMYTGEPPRIPLDQVFGVTTFELG